VACGAGVREVGPDGVVEEVGVLGDDADGIVQSSPVVASRRSTPLIRTGPGRGVVEPRDEGGDGRLAGTARADQGDEGPGSTDERDLRSTGPLPRRSVTEAVLSSEASDTSSADG
jgi:hypothetical protein